MAQVLRRLVVSAAIVGVTAGSFAVPTVPALADPPHKSNPSEDNGSSANYVPPAPAPAPATESTSGSPTPSGSTEVSSSPSSSTSATSSPSSSSTPSSSTSSSTSPTPSESPLPVIALPEDSGSTSPQPVPSTGASGSPAPTPTFTLPLPPGFAATKVDVFADPAASEPQGRLSGLVARTGGPGVAFGILGLVAAVAGAVLVLRRRS